MFLQCREGDHADLAIPDREKHEHLGAIDVAARVKETVDARRKATEPTEHQASSEEVKRRMKLQPRYDADRPRGYIRCEAGLNGAHCTSNAAKRLMAKAMRTVNETRCSVGASARAERPTCSDELIETNTKRLIGRERP